MTVRTAITAAAKGCHAMFGDWLRTFRGENQPASLEAVGSKRTLKLKRTVPATK